MEIGAGLFCYHAGQRQQGDDVGESHQGIENISDGPHGGHRQIRADKDRGDLQPTIAFDGGFVAVCKVFQAAFAVVVPAKNGCKSEEDQAQHQDKRGHRGGERQSYLESAGRDLYAFQAQFRHPGFG